MIALTLTGSATFAETLPTPKKSAGVPINRIVAVINQDIVTQADLNNAMTAMKQQFRKHNIPLPSKAKLRQTVLQGLIYQKLQLQIAKQNNVVATDQQVDDAIQRIVGFNKITVAQLKQNLKQSNISYKAFRQQIRDKVTINTLQQQAIAGKIHITDAQVAQYKQKLENQNQVSDYHVIDYLIPFTKNTPQEKQLALQQANTLIDQLTNGQSITDKAVKVNDMGWNTLNDLPDLFSVKIAKMANGSISKPILASNGYHVLKLVSTKMKSNTITLQQARQLLFQKKFQAALKKWLKQLRSTAYVKVYNTN